MLSAWVDAYVQQLQEEEWGAGGIASIDCLTSLGLSCSSTELARPQGRAGSPRPQLTLGTLVSGRSQAQQQALLNTKPSQLAMLSAGGLLLSQANSCFN